MVVSLCTWQRITQEIESLDSRVVLAVDNITPAALRPSVFFRSRVLASVYRSAIEAESMALYHLVTSFLVSRTRTSGARDFTRIFSDSSV